MKLFLKILYCLPILLLHLQIREVNPKGICLYFSEKMASWFDALIVCQKNHMCLADLNTEVTLVQMATKTDHKEHEYWFGLNAYDKSNYRYVSNNKSIEFSPINSKLVNDGRCAYIKHVKGFYIFEGANCRHRKRFICTRTDECDGVSMKPVKSQCVITEEEKKIVAY
ncbi:uncharacterized protein LOC108104879 [Drosophila eugracilis]|uniref:uncharacterized protein LOC108104879 n=1 Tax=Drosophila eugracilis TaxID=29029 RepID=UPI0007E7257B|nr:uncharacterized protein LOC108104879 [Drosophila eugracilis]